MLKPVFTTQFRRDLNKQIKAGKDKEKIQKITRKLINNEKLEEKYRLHKLTGKLKDRWECHIEPDWVIIYVIKHEKIFFERTGSHSNLFK